MRNEDDRVLDKAERDRITAQHWGATRLRDAWSEDREILAIRAFLDTLDSVPEWMLRIPIPNLDGCLEMCGHRWLDGLDRAFMMIGQARTYPAGGSCGDAPGYVFMQAEERLLGIQAWLSDEIPVDGIPKRVAELLGEKTDPKVEAVQALADIMQGYVLCAGDGAAILEQHKGKAETNAALGVLYQGNWLYEVLENACGFGYLPSLDLAIRLSAGDESCEKEWLSCGGALRQVFRDEPLRYEAAQSYLWGLQAYLQGHDAAWLRENRAGLAGGAIRTLAKATSQTEDTPAKSWIAASLLKGIKIQLVHVLETAENVPAGAHDLPDVVEGLQTAVARFRK
jgi:hypothetical protein